MDGRRRLRMIMIALVSCGMSGCGLYVPNIQEVWDQDYPGDPNTKTPRITGTGQIEFEIKKHVWCELKDAVQAANKYPVEDNENGKIVRGPILPDNWGADVTLSLEVDESTALNPGVALNTPIHSAITHFVGEGSPTSSTNVTSGLTFPFLSTPQSYSFGFGGTLSATGTRIDKFDSHYSIAHLMKRVRSESVCNYARPANDPFVTLGVTPASSSLLIESELGLRDWLVGAMFASKALRSDPAPVSAPTPKSLNDERQILAKQGFKPAEIVQVMATKASASSGAGSGGASSLKSDTVSIEIKFIIVSNGNATPTWKLVRASANTGNSPLFAAGRTRTHDLIVTIGPSTPDTANTHLASQIGNAVSSGNRTTLGAVGGGGP